MKNKYKKKYPASVFVSGRVQLLQRMPVRDRVQLLLLMINNRIQVKVKLKYIIVLKKLIQGKRMVRLGPQIKDKEERKKIEIQINK